MAAGIETPTDLTNVIGLLQHGNVGHEKMCPTDRTDADAEKHGQLSVIDESGEDYLYPVTAFDRIN